MDNNSLSSLNVEILRGYSQEVFDERSIFIKHSDMYIMGLFDSVYQANLKKAQNEHLPLKKVAELALKDNWPPEKEEEIKKHKLLIDTNIINKDKAYLPSVKRKFQKEIDNLNESLNKLLREKNAIIGETAESFAERIANRSLVRYTCFSDESLTKPFFNEYDNETDVFDLYLAVKAKFDDHAIKTLACSQFIMNYFLACNDNAYNFYGKPVKDLTVYQIALFHHIKHFKYIFSKNDQPIPQSIRENPEKLIEWFEAKENGKRLLEETKEDNISLVGATDEDIKLLGLEHLKPKNNIAEALTKAGGSLSMQQMIDMGLI